MSYWAGFMEGGPEEAGVRPKTPAPIMRIEEGGAGDGVAAAVEEAMPGRKWSSVAKHTGEESSAAMVFWMSWELPGPEKGRRERFGFSWAFEKVLHEPGEHVKNHE
jgi:hypothetical protein